MKDNLDEIYMEYLKLTERLVAVEKFSPMAVAGVMMAQAMSIYKTSMTDSEFNSMVDAVSDSRDSVKKFTSDITLQ